MQRFVHRAGVGVIAWRQGGAALVAATLAPKDSHRRIVGRGRHARVSGVYVAASGAGNATGTVAAISLTAPTASATGDAAATGDIAQITLTAPTGFAIGASAAAGDATGSIASISLTAPTAMASGGGNAYASIRGITLTAPTGSATGDYVAQVAGAMAGGKRLARIQTSTRAAR